MTALRRAAEYFRQAYHSVPSLAQAQRDWSCHITLQSTDTAALVTFCVEDGAITALTDTAAHHPAQATVEVLGPQELLQDILYLRRSPAEPYLFGDIIVRGPEADFLRLDYITAQLEAP